MFARSTVLAVLIGAVPPLLHGQTLIPTGDRDTTETDTIAVTVLGNGNIRQVLTGEGEAGSDANGAAAVRLRTQFLILTALVNVTSSLASQDGNFGQLLLSPANGAGLRTGVIDIRKKQLLAGNTGGHGYLSLSSSDWIGSADTVNAVVAGLGVLLYRQIGASNGENRVALSVEAGPSARLIMGDIASREDVRQELLGTKTKAFVGLEAGMGLSVNRVTTGIQFYYYFGPQIPGFTRGQLTTGISVETDILSFSGDREGN